MTAKTDWADGQTVAASDLNDLGTEINSQASDISTLDSRLDAVPYDVTIVGVGGGTARAASSYGDFPFGVKLQRAVVFTSVTFRAATASASGNLVVELRKNGTTVAGTSTTIATANQVTGGTSTGTWPFAAGDILAVYTTAVGTTPGNGLIADIKGTATA